jgi:hypothetical protein
VSDPFVDPEGERFPVHNQPGRTVGVEITQILDEPWSDYRVTLVFDQEGRPVGDEAFVWLTPREARTVAAALTRWEDEAEERNRRRHEGPWPEP